MRAVAAPALGILLLATLPYRFFLIQFIDLLTTLGTEAEHYGNLLTAVAVLITGGLILATYGRAVFVRACSDPPACWRDLLRVPLRTFLGYLYLTLLLELVLILFIFTFVGVPLVILIAGVAAAASVENLPPGVIAPLRALAPYLRHGRVLVGLLVVFSIGLLAALPNVYFLFRLGLWAAQAIPGFDAVRWELALTSGHPRFVLVLFALAVTILEPFWLAAMQVYGDRVRSRESGEDLRRRFLEVTTARARKLALPAAAILFMIGLPAFAQESISVEQYIGSLEQIRTDLGRGDTATASTRAGELSSVKTVTRGDQSFTPDLAVLKAVSDTAAHPETTTAVSQRLAVTITALREVGEARSVRVDPKLLEQLRASEQAEELWRGGEVFAIPATNPGVFEQLGSYFRRAIDWLAAKLERFYDWLRKLMPKRRRITEERREFFGIPMVVWIVTLLVVGTMLLLAAYVLRRSRRATAPVVSEESAQVSARDADPLSRESNEWERYAQELAAKGRIREAIRAWYHAVLVGLYRAGVLHYRRGVTNWEYIRTLSPAVSWRPQFIDMTRQFETEWYGHHEGTRDVLDQTARQARTILGSVREAER